MATKEGKKDWGEFVWSIGAIVLLLGALAVGVELVE